MEELRSYAKELLVNREAAAVIGYEMSGDKRTRPVIITEPYDTGRLVLNEYCLNNLTVYLTKARIKAMTATANSPKRLAVTVKPCDIRSIVALIKENQIRREDVVIISMNCHGVVRDFGCEFNSENLAAKCTHCSTPLPEMSDKTFGEIREILQKDDFELKKISDLKQLPPERRLEYFRNEFDKCIKCYACRAVCPLCYCQRCITDKTIPRWIEASSHSRGNFSWNIVRAFHLAGRCTGCGECDRACPMDIPLSLINREMANVCTQLFGYDSGSGIDKPTLVGSFDKKDSNEIFM